MADNRDIILADFQACTDIDDVGEAILQLETHDWDLLAAINNVTPKTTQQLPSETQQDVEMINNDKSTPRSSQSSNVSSNKNFSEIKTGKEAKNSKISEGIHHSSTSNEEIKNITFQIHFKHQMFPIEISNSSTVGDLKSLIFAKTNVSPCLQKLTGWPEDPKDDSSILKSLKLKNIVNLYLPEVEIGDISSEKISDRLTSKYNLVIEDKTKNITYNLNFPGTYTILDVKSNIYTLNDIPVRNQLWKGWPASVQDDSITLAQSGIPASEYSLTVERIPSKDTKKEIVDVENTDSSTEEEQEDVEELEDTAESFQVDDDIFIDYVQTNKVSYLIPDNVDNEIVGTMHFAEEYEKRYGPAHPNFYTGTFEDALAESCSKSPRERKLFAVYLHHDKSILANVFCTQLLNFETVLQLLSTNFIVWGWDCTRESNKQKLLTSMHILGPAASTVVKNLNVDMMPVLIIIMKSRSNPDIFTIIHGNVGINDFITQLIEAVDVFQDQRKNDIDIEEERQARERVKEEQDQAYQESLAADRAKEEAKKLLKNMEQQQKEQVESKQRAEQARKEAHRLAVESHLPPEPPLESNDDVIKVKLRLPSGEFLERRFLSNVKLQILFDYLIVRGYPTEDYKVISSWPRRDLTTIDSDLSLRELKFAPQEQLIIEER